MVVKFPQMAFAIRWTRVFTALAVCFFFSAASAADWDSCADNLYQLRRAAQNAADKANEVKGKSEEFENCRRHPDMYDLLGDRCQSKASDYESAARGLENELDTVDSRIRSVRSSCGYDLASVGPAYQGHTPNSGNRFCDLYRSYKGRMPLDALLKTCKQSMSEAECKKCLLAK